MHHGRDDQEFSYALPAGPRARLLNTQVLPALNRNPGYFILIGDRNASEDKNPTFVLSSKSNKKHDPSIHIKALNKR